MHKHLKSIVSNTVAQLVAKFVGAGTTLLVTVLIIRLSGPALFGDLTKSLVLIAVGMTAIDFGLNAVVVRNLSKVKNTRLLMSDVIGARLLLSALAILAVNVLVFLLPGGYTPAIKSIFWVGSLAILFQGLATSMNAWFQYQENYWSSAWGTIIGALVSAAMTYYYVFAGPTLLHFLLANTIGYLATALTAIYLGRKGFLLALRPGAIFKLTRSSLLLGGILLASITASKVDSIILGVMRTSAEVGQYGFAYRIFDVILVLPVFIMNAVYPKLVKEEVKVAAQIIYHSLWILGLLGVLVAAVSWFLAPWILFIRPGLTLSVTSLRILLYSLPFFFLTAPLMWQQISRQKEKSVFVIYVFAALINAGLNLLWIPHYGVPAAAWVTGITELYILLALIYSSRSLQTTH